MRRRPTYLRQVYTPDEVAALLAINVRTVYRRLEDGSIPSLTRVGKPLRIPIEEFHRIFPGLRKPVQLTFPFSP